MEGKFDPKKYLRKVKGNADYLEVKYRLLWAREERGDEIDIETRIEHLDVDKGVAVVRADVWSSTSGKREHLSSGTKMEQRKDFPDFLEKAETGAIGRALGVLGYGTQWAIEFDEGERLADSPIPAKADDGVPKVDKTLANKIIAAYKKSGKSDDEFVSMLAEYGVKRIGDLTRAQAMVMLTALSGKAEVDGQGPQRKQIDGVWWEEQPNGEWAKVE